MYLITDITTHQVYGPYSSYAVALQVAQKHLEYNGYRISSDIPLPPEDHLILFGGPTPNLDQDREEG
jgi:hypothetical protein